MSASSTTVQWTMKLSDASLICDTLRHEAESLDRQADYLEGETYAEQQRERYMTAPRKEGERRRRSEWKLSDSDQKRIVEFRSRAARLRILVES